MTEEKKGWFQKFKNVVLGEEKEKSSLADGLSLASGQKEHTPSDNTDSLKTEEDLVKKFLLQEEINQVEKETAEKSETAGENLYPSHNNQQPFASPKTEEDLVKESFQTEELKEIVGEGLTLQVFPNETNLSVHRPSQILHSPVNVNPLQAPLIKGSEVKLEIGKGKIPFQDLKPNEKNDLISDLRSQETPLTIDMKQEEPPKKAPVPWLPPVVKPELSEQENHVGAIHELPLPEENTTAGNLEAKKKGWFSKVVNTLNAPIEFKVEAVEGDNSFLAKLKGNVSIGLGKPKVELTDEDIEKWKENLREKLSLTRESFTAKLVRLMQGRTKIDEDLLEEIEDILLESDVGVDMTEAICNKLRILAKEKRFLPSEVMPSLFDYLREQLDAESQRIVIDDTRLNIIMMVGVNGTGKTTTTGKMAAKFRISDYSVILAAADTFRAAAIDQLDVWSQRAQVPLIKHQENSDAAAVVYDAIKAAKARNTNVLLIDTAGRLHNKTNLMEELKKIRRIIDREAPEAKLEVLLVLDGTTGQNGLKQATVFSEAVKLTGVVLTKLDGTAKGGVIFSIKNSLKLPIKLVGVGEGIEDLRDFEPQIFIDALFSEKNEAIIEESTKITSRPGKS